MVIVVLLGVMLSYILPWVAAEGLHYFPLRYGPTRFSFLDSVYSEHRYPCRPCQLRFADHEFFSDLFHRVICGNLDHLLLTFVYIIKPQLGYIVNNLLFI
jgi:hypothetical protein